MNRPKKVLICINKLGSGGGMGGAERLVVDDINEMIERGPEVRLLTLREESQFSLANELKLPKENWHVIPAKNIWDIRSWIIAYQYLKKERPDILFTHLWESNTVIGPLAKILGIKLVAFEHNVYDTIKTRKMFLVDRFLQHFTHKIIAVSRAVQGSLISHGIKEGKIVVINNGIKLEKYNPEKNFDLKKNPGTPEESFIFISIGRLIHQKGMDILLQAFSKLGGNPQLLIVGDGKERSSLENLAKKLNLEKRAHFLGIRSDIPELLSAADAFVLASRYEGLGIVVLEAMASKLPIIISDFEAGKDMIEDGVNGLVVERENVEDFKKAMEKLMGDEGLRKTLALKAFEKVKEFSIEEHVNKILSL